MQVVKDLLEDLEGKSKENEAKLKGGMTVLTQLLVGDLTMSARVIAFKNAQGGKVIGGLGELVSSPIWP